MEETKLREIEKEAIKIIRIENEIYEKYDWPNGNGLDKKIHLGEFKEKFGIKKIHPINYWILENINYSSLIRVLQKGNYFEGNIDSAREEYDDYTNSGGRTLDLIGI